jgi:glucosamine-6-phosphate deaminase
MELPSPPRGLRTFEHQGLEFHVYPTAVVMGRASAVALAQMQIKLAAQQERVGFLMMAAPSGYGFYDAYIELAMASRSLQAALGQTHFFQFDDYPLRPDHPASFRYLLNEHLFEPLSQWCPCENVHLLAAESEDVDATLAAYTRTVLDSGPDLQLKGVGENGHWGFHEPGIPLEGDPAYIRVALSHENAVQQLRDHPDVFHAIDDVPREAFTANVQLFLRTRHRIEDNIPQASKAFAVLAGYGTAAIDAVVPTSALKGYDNAVVRLTEDAAWALETYRDKGHVHQADVDRMLSALGGGDADRTSMLTVLETMQIEVRA